MQAAGFAAFRDERAGAVTRRITELDRDLADYDVIRLHEKLTGRVFDPLIEVVLLQFCKPHGIKVQGQTFLQAADWNTPTTVRNAAHEMLHPPVPMDGAAAQAALRYWLATRLSRISSRTTIPNGATPRSKACSTRISPRRSIS